MFGRVLTATDMLDACDAALVTALEIAKQNQGKLFVMHVLEPSYFHECGPRESVKDFKTGEDVAASQEYQNTVKDELDKKCAGTLRQYGNYQIDIAYGRPSIEIRRWARKTGADLIVLGPHAGKEEEGLIGTTIGNTVEDVIVHATSPVMVVNRLVPREKLHFKKIMVSVDFSRSCKEALKFAIKLAEKYESKLLLFHMFNVSGSEQSESQEDVRSSEDKLKRFYAIPQHIEHVYNILQGTQPYLEILKYSREKDVDLIVMGSHTTVEDKRWYVGSSVEQVSAQSVCPVTIVTHPEAFLKTEK